MGRIDPSVLAVARGDRPADLVLRNARLVNVASGEIYTTDLAIAAGRIAGLGDGYRGAEEVDLEERYVCPGLIDAHVHVESAMVPPAEFARMVVPRGVTAAVTDPHEIANVVGIDGIRFMLREARRSALAMYVNAPSCVPATPLGTAGAHLGAVDLAPLRDVPEVLGLAEVMDYPAVVAGERRVLDKLDLFSDRVLDGHCPGLTGQALCAYAASGIRSDHECTTLEEAREKLRLGFTVFLREATFARNLEDLLPLVTPETERRLCLCTDDRQIPDLVEEGSVDHLVRLTIAAGVEPITALRMATLNVASHFGFHSRGMLAPGRMADLFVCEDLRELRAERVYVRGRLTARDGEMLLDRPVSDPDFTHTVNVNWRESELRIPALSTRVRAIGVVPNQLVTESLVVDARIEDGLAVADPERDLLKMAVFERHRATGRVGLGFVKGLGLKRGALAGTVAHDHHNLVAVGADDTSMAAAALAVAATGGGLAVADGDTILARLPLPIAGLMSHLPHAQVGEQLAEVLEEAAGLGASGRDPFMAMSFLALEVIPSLKLTDRGLVDVDKMEFVPLFTEK